MRRLLICFRFLFAAPACALLLVYLVARLLSDRFLVTQFVFWVPSIFVIAAAAFLAIGAALAGLQLRKLEPGERRRRSLARTLSRLAALGAILAALHLFLVQWRLLSFLSPAPAPRDGTSELVLVHWNMTFVSPAQWDRFIAAIPREPMPDIVLVNNPPWAAGLARLAESLGPEYRAKRCGIFAIVSRLPILQTGASPLDLPMVDPALRELFSPLYDPESGDTEYLPEWSSIPRLGNARADPGNVMFARVDATSILGREITLWGMDLPSDIRRPRFQLARLAREKLRSLQLPAPPPSPGATASSAPRRPPIFPNPDIITGDFNTPRDSASLAYLLPGFTHAFHQAGRGYAASWPRPLPLFHIDHTYLAPGLRATSYRLVDPGEAEHLVQVTTVVRTGP
jgi:hypothetical protein